MAAIQDAKGRSIFKSDEAASFVAARRLKVATLIVAEIRRRGWNQAQFIREVGLFQADAHDIMAGRLKRMDLERLLVVAAKLGLDLL